MFLPLTWLCAAFLNSAYAGETTTLNSTVRALGMGDAFTAVADDYSSLFYNPAGLAKVRGLNWRVFGVDAGVSDIKDYQTVKNATNDKSATLANDLGKLYGHNVSAMAGAESFFTMPAVGFGVYDHASVLAQVNNPVYPQLHTRAINDMGYVLGFGAPLAPNFHAGFDVKYVKRTGTDETFGPSSVADLNSSTFSQNLTQWGDGYGADFGVSYLIPAPFFTATLSAAWKNLGGMTFTSGNGSSVPSEENDITAGGALKFKLPMVTITPALDFTYLNDASIQLTQKINFGIELGLPLVDIRGGFHEGYYTAGVGVNLGLFRVDAATYGEELGDYPGQIEDRRYVIQFAMQVGIGDFSLSDLAGGSSSTGSGSSSGSSDSSWGSGRLKQRR